jgi:mannosyltransferase OCH1-like enzyme
MSIPKVIIQTSRERVQPYIIDKIKKQLPDWEYLHFNDDEIMQFFAEYPLEEFPNVRDRFYSFNYGSHRADLFRYYYLYVKGGVYMDTDAMIYTNIDDVLGNYEFFSVNSNYFPKTIFQGFIGCVPGNIILYEALKDLYFIDNRELLANFHVLCKNLYSFVNNHENDCRIKLYEEIYGNSKDAHVVDADDENNKLVVVHYHIDKIIPN